MEERVQEMISLVREMDKQRGFRSSEDTILEVAHAVLEVEADIRRHVMSLLLMHWSTIKELKNLTDEKMKAEIEKNSPKWGLGAKELEAMVYILEDDDSPRYKVDIDFIERK